MSAVTFAVGAVVIAVGGAWLTRRWRGIQPDTPPEGTEARLAALEGFDARQAPANVRRWRKALVAGLLVGWSLVWVASTTQATAKDTRALVEAQEVREEERNREACQSRFTSRDEVRALAVAMVDEVALFADLTPAERTRLIRLAEVRAADELPPPDCSGKPTTTSTTTSSTTTTEPAEPATSSTGVLVGPGPYSSCAEAPGPIAKGEPGYSPNLDGDGDGTACEG